MVRKSDKDYINQILEGDTNAFTLLVDQYKNLVFTLALKMLKNREEAEEVSQDTFIKVYKSLHKFSGGSKFSSWIYKITYNTCLDRLRKLKRKQHVVPIDEINVHQIKVIENALDALEKEEYKQSIQDCLAMLQSEDSFLLTLYYFKDCSMDEISKVMGITSNNVKIKLFRCRKKLATILLKRLEPETISIYEKY